MVSRAQKGCQPVLELVRLYGIPVDQGHLPLDHDLDILVFLFLLLGLLAPGQCLVTTTVGLDTGANQEEDDQVERDVPGRLEGGSMSRFELRRRIFIPETTPNRTAG
ncbi:MAG: hypothetical protein Ct9H300mP1_17320 [Planctomycetaceae bacterium]|nr:MAG: hypothetical protein Ct9H300mP1_17320 [Planctomycetaceae bacterium]